MVTAIREELKSAHADVTRGDARENGAGEQSVANYVFARRDRRQRSRRRNAESRHRFAHDVFAQDRAESRAPVAPAALPLRRRLFQAIIASARRRAGQVPVTVKLRSGLRPEDRAGCALALRLAKMLGIRSARKLAGRLIPGVAIAFNAIGNERRTRQLADKAIRFYGG